MSSGSKKGTQIYYSFHSKSSGKRIPSRFPNGAPVERDTRLQRIFMSLLSLFIFPSESAAREPLPCSLTGSPWSGILRHQNHWSIHSFIHSFMYSYVCRSPQKGVLLQMGKSMWSPSTEPHAEGRPTYNGVRPGSPRGSLTILLSLPQCHAAFSTIPSILAWVDQSPISQRVQYVATHIRVYPLQLLPPSTWPRVEYESTIPRGTDEGLD